MKNVRILLHLLVGIGALAAGQALIRDRTGGSMTFKTEWLQGSPFDDYLVPGLFLFFVNGGLNLAAAYGMWRGRWWAAAVSFAAGVVLVAWILIQWAIIGYRSWTQWMWLVTFVTMLALATQHWRRWTTATAAHFAARRLLSWR